jgi:transposase InsO family protein
MYVFTCRVNWSPIPHMTIRSSIFAILDDSINRYGKPLELLTDHGSQFYANFGEMKSAGTSKFQQYLIDRKINHILGRVHHPQTNGKIERFYETFQSKIQHFNSMEEFVTKRPYMPLNWDQLETPIQAFCKKIDRRRKPYLEEKMCKSVSGRSPSINRSPNAKCSSLVRPATSITIRLPELRTPTS